jgi:hypothetical protein
MSARGLAFVISLLFLTGCAATPDLAAWAENSAALATGVAEQNTSATAKFDEIVSEIKIGEDENWVPTKSYKTSDFANRRDNYKVYAEAINAGMGAMVQYAQAVSNLAAAGETGKEASESLMKSVKSIVDTVGVAIPLAPAAVTAVTEVIDTLADALTRMQAQDTLAKTMSEMQPHIDALSRKIKKYVSLQKNIVTSIRAVRGLIIQGKYGPKRISASKTAYGKLEKIAGGGAHGVAEPPDQLERDSAHYRKYVKELSAETAWLEAQKDALDELAAASSEWTKSHGQAADYLVKCGGTRSLKPSCGQFTAANLKKFAGRVQNAMEFAKKNF